MSNIKSVKDAVDRGAALRAEIERLQEELEECEQVLREAALAGEQVPLEDEELEGRQYLARGSELVVPVVITSDLLIQSFRDGSPQHVRLEALAGERLGEFFRREVVWRNLARTGKEFRLHAAAELGEKGPEFVSACVQRDKYGVPRYRVQVHWERGQSEGEEVAA